MGTRQWITGALSSYQKPGRQSGWWNIPEYVHGVTRLRVTSVWHCVDFYTHLAKGDMIDGFDKALFV